MRVVENKFVGVPMKMNVKISMSILPSLGEKTFIF